MIPSPKSILHITLVPGAWDMLSIPRSPRRSSIAILGHIALLTGGRVVHRGRLQDAASAKLTLYGAKQTSLPLRLVFFRILRQERVCIVNCDER